ncbi:MAG: FAD-dependent oxidoreductase [Polyangiaceae bacterium]
MNSSPDSYDAIVVGAGAAGLAAAFVLRQAGKRVLILEERDQIGGRIETLEKSEHTGIDLGAAYFGPLQSYTMRFVELLGIERISNDLHPEFYHRIEWSSAVDPAYGRLFKYNHRSFGVPDAPNPSIRANLRRSLGLLAGFVPPQRLLPPPPGAPSNSDQLTANCAMLEALVLKCRCFLHNPWDDPQLAQLDQISVEDWLKAAITNPLVGDLLRVGVRAALSCETTELSMLYLVYYCATGGSFVNVMAVGGGADSYRFRRGAIDLPRRLAATVVDPNPPWAGGATLPPATMLVGKGSVKMENHPDHVAVTTKDGHIYRADRVIVAVSPHFRNSLGIVGLPQQHAELAELVVMGRTIKTFAVFNTPWWREERGASGYTLSARNTHDCPIVWTMNNSFELEGKADTTVHCLMGFIVGSRADEMASLTVDQRKDRVLHHWSTLFEVPRNTIDANFKEYHEKLWDKASFSGGCPASFFPPGKFTTHGKYLREPFGRIHWASAETATDWVGGYINGALQSGVRAASEVIASGVIASGPATSD